MSDYPFVWVIRNGMDEVEEIWAPVDGEDVDRTELELTARTFEKGITYTLVRQYKEKKP